LLGYLVLNVELDFPDSRTVLLNLETGEEIIVGNTGWGTRYDLVSPDGTRLAHWDSDLNAFQVLGVAKNSFITIPDPDGRLFLKGWTDNDHLLVFKRLNEFQTGGFIRGALIQVDITSKVQQYWSTDDFPLFNGDWYVTWTLTINPEASMMVFPSRDGFLVAPTVLWDMETNSELARIHVGNLSHPPQWAPDGNSFMTSAPPVFVSDEGGIFVNSDDGMSYFGGSEIFVVNTSGAIERLTYFTSTATTEIDSYWWSPDGSKILFNMQVGSEPLVYGGMALFDLDTRSTLRYCQYGRPIWYPSGKYIAFTSYVDHSPVVHLLDLETAETWLIRENASVGGWMAPVP
jgi:Tol biopolymer transport system component